MENEDQLKSAIAVYRQYQNALIAQGGVSAMNAKPGPVRSIIHQQIEVTNGNFTFKISADGEFIKIERVGDGNVQRMTGGFFLIPIEMWDEVVNFVFQETQRRKADAE